MPRNPYLNRSMIRAVDQFHGRTEELRRIMERLDAQPPQSVSLVGERRVGKSSLLWHMAQPEIHAQYLEHPDQYLFLLIDFQGQQHLDQARFCHLLHRQMQRACQGRIEIPDGADLGLLEETIQDLDAAGLRLVCLFDEFEAVTRNPAFGAEFFGLLRSLANAYPVAYVTASRRDLQVLCHDREISESPFFNIFTQIHVGPMPEDEIETLIAGPSAASGIPLAPHREALTDLSGHLPFFVQMACAAAFDHLTGQADTALDMAQVEKRFDEEATNHFRYLQQNFDPSELQIVEALANDRPLAADWDAIFQALTRDGYIRPGPDREPRLFSRAFARFLVSAEPPPQPVPEPTAPNSSRRPLLYGIAAVLVAAMIYLGYAALPGPTAEDAALEISFDTTPTERPTQLVLDPDIPTQLTLLPQQAGFLYAYYMYGDGTISSGLESPLGLQAGQTAQLALQPEPAAPDSLVLVANRQRDRELEEMAQQQLRAGRARRLALRDKIQTHLHTYASGGQGVFYHSLSLRPR
ncbi:MAG: hypothetical protein GKR89_26440 [Candidatus Latescibacteria bacterium]|nr:hypothetical protein [Candidatus Latescibacterota bacterium]